MHILIVEDHCDSAAALALLLERQGYVVSRAHSLAEANFLCRRQLFSLLLCDIALPDGDGWQFLCDLRGACLDVPAIAISAFSTPEDRRRSLEAGFAAHVSKPIHVAGLLQVIRWVLGRSLPPIQEDDRPADGH